MEAVLSNQIIMSTKEEERLTDYELLAKEIRELGNKVNPPLPSATPLGLFAFGFTASLLQVKSTRLGGTDPEDFSGTQVIVTGVAMMFGGLLHIIVGLVEARRNNLFGFTAFSLFAGFWLSLAMNDLIQYFADDPPAPNTKAVQTWLFNTAIFTTVLWIIAFKLHKTMWVLLLSLAITLVLLAFGVENENADKVGGYLGLITSGIAYWLASVELVNHFYGEGKELIPLGAPILETKRVVAE